MSQFIESIKILNGEIFRLTLHQERLDMVCCELLHNRKINLTEIIENQSIPTKGLFKLRILFDQHTHDVEIIPYQLPKITSLKLTETDLPSVFYKSSDREKIRLAFDQKKDCDDVLFLKNNLITDSSYCNVALFDGENWITPQNPLILGTQRKFLLQHNQIKEKDISVNHLSVFQTICLFNALIEFGEIVFPVENIKTE